MTDIAANPRLNQENSNLDNQLIGSVERVTFHNTDNGFCVLKVAAIIPSCKAKKVKEQNGLIPVVGYCSSITAGEQVQCHGSWHNDLNHGLQFKATNIKTIEPTSLQGIEKYLSSGLVKGIGPGYAKRLINAFGREVLTVISEEPERLESVPGLGKKRIKKILDSWSEQQKIREIVVFLHQYGVKTAKAVKIYKFYGDNALNKIKHDPYCLALDIKGIGFKSADLLAVNLGIPRDSFSRMQAGVRHVLQEIASTGSCGVAEDNLLSAASTMLELEQSLVSQAIEKEIQVKRIVRINQHILMSAGLHNAEKNVANRIKALQQSALPWDQQRLEKVISKSKLNHLSPQQLAAVNQVVSSKVTIITGGPGVGKTTVLKSILEIIKRSDIKILLSAPTGRAAKRLAETTGMEAQTLHRLLKIEPGTNVCQYNQNNPIPADLLIVDEVSMVDIILMNTLMSALSNKAALLLVGDSDQLPSVGPGRVLGDLLDSKIITSIKLTEVFRQVATSKIITTAHQINLGKLPSLTSCKEQESDFYFIKADEPLDIKAKLLEVVANRIPNKFNFDPFSQIQVLTPMNKGPLGAISLNLDLKSNLNNTQQQSISRFGTNYSVGDKVIQYVNNYDKEAYNGDIGYISSLDVEMQEVLVDFDGREVIYDINDLDELGLAYAITIHKSQGSEYPAVVIPVAMQHYNLLQRNLIYTGITRGKQLVVVIGQAKAMAMAVKNINREPRVTCLQERLMD